jgi:hypothetical protein
MPAPATSVDSLIVALLGLSEKTRTAVTNAITAITVTPVIASHRSRCQVSLEPGSLGFSEPADALDFFDIVTCFTEPFLGLAHWAFS